SPPRSRARPRKCAGPKPSRPPRRRRARAPRKRRRASAADTAGGRSAARTIVQSQRITIDMASTQILAGFHAVVARLRHAPDTVKDIYVEAQRRDKRMLALIEQAGRAGLPVHPVAMERLDGMARRVRHQGVVAMADTRQLALDIDEVLDGIAGPALLLALDGVTDPQKLGASLR